MNTPTADTRSITQLRQFVSDCWRLAKPYWSSEDRWAARGLLAVVVAMNLGLVYINVLLNKWQSTFFNAIQEKNAEVFFRQLWVFTGLALAFIAVAVYQLYLNQMLQIRWPACSTRGVSNAACGAPTGLAPSRSSTTSRPSSPSARTIA